MDRRISEELRADVQRTLEKMAKDLLERSQAMLAQASAFYHFTNRDPWR